MAGGDDLGVDLGEDCWAGIGLEEARVVVGASVNGFRKGSNCKNSGSRRGLGFDEAVEN